MTDGSLNVDDDAFADLDDDDAADLVSASAFLV